MEKELVSRKGVSTEWAFNPSFNIEEIEGHYIVTTELTGVPKENINVSVEGGRLKVSSHIQSKTRGKEDGYSFLRRYERDIDKELMLPFNVNVDSAEASYADGVLRVALEKAEKPATKSIRIEEGRTGFWAKLLGKKNNAQPAAVTKATGQTAS